MKKPDLHKLDFQKTGASDKALVFIPGMCSEHKQVRNSTTEAIEKSGWHGEIYYLWWDSSKMESLIKYTPLGPPGIIAKIKMIEDDATKTGRKYLPGVLNSELQGKKVTFVAHSMGVYMLYKLFKKPEKYPISVEIEDVILLGGAVRRSKEKWRRTAFRLLYNVYNEHDKVLKLWKYPYRVLTGHRPKSPCGRRPIKKMHVVDVVNIDASDLLSDDHFKYYKVFTSGRLLYKGNQWVQCNL